MILVTGGSGFVGLNVAERACLRLAALWHFDVRVGRLAAAFGRWEYTTRAIVGIDPLELREGDIDLKQFIESDARPIVTALRDRAAFAAIRVEMDTVVWENGFDLAPEFLRARAKPCVPA